MEILHIFNIIFNNMRYKSLQKRPHYEAPDVSRIMAGIELPLLNGSDGDDVITIDEITEEELEW